MILFLARGRAVIVGMSKVEITGPRALLLPVLDTLQRSGVLQIDAGIKERNDEAAIAQVRPLALDGKTLAKRLFLEDLALKVDRLLSLLPAVEARESYLSPSRAINSIAAIVGKHLQAAEDAVREREARQTEIAQINRYLVFLATIESLAPRGPEAAGLEYIGVEVRYPAALEQLTRVAKGRFEAHARHTDLQYVWSGRERIEICDLRASIPTPAYDASGNVFFPIGVDAHSHLLLQAGEVAACVVAAGRPRS